MRLDYLYEITRQLIEADTVSHHASTPALELLANHLRDAGLEVRLQTWEDGAKANLVAVAGPPAPDGLVLSGHVDVVPFEGQPGWTREPLHLGVEDRRLYGRGTTDMKGFLGQCVAAVRELDLDTLRRPLVLLFTSDEEIGCLGGERLARELTALLADVPLPRFGWIGEPSSWRLFHAHKGVGGFEVEVRGSGGHSSRPDRGVNAIAVAARALVALGELQQQLREQGGSEGMRALFPDAPYATLNLGTIEGGTAGNMIAESCRFTVTYRPLPDRDPMEIHERARTVLGELEARDWGGSGIAAELRVSPALVAPGLLAARGSPLERGLLEEPGVEPAGGAPYCTDGGQLAAAGLACLICGPGDLDQAHQPDESIDRRAFEEGPERILRVAQRLLGASPP